MSEDDVLRQELKSKDEFIINILTEMKVAYETLDHIRAMCEKLKFEFSTLTRLIDKNG